MMYMFGFVVLCMALGFWAPKHPKMRLVIAGMAFLLVVFFLLSPSRL